MTSLTQTVKPYRPPRRGNRTKLPGIDGEVFELSLSRSQNFRTRLLQEGAYLEGGCCCNRGTGSCDQDADTQRAFDDDGIFF